MSSAKPSSPSATSVTRTRRTSTNHHYTDSPESRSEDALSTSLYSNSNHNELSQLQNVSTITDASKTSSSKTTDTGNARSTHQSMSGIESTIRFLLLPSQIFIVLLLEFLNSFRSFGLRFILYNYITNEFGIGDTHAGVLLGIKGFVDIGFGLAGSILVDIVGVRRISLVALSVALVGRTLLAFGRTKATLYPALFLFSPCGDALLSTGLYAVALKKLTTPLTRPLAFAISYATFNLAGAFADIILDKMRASVDDFTGTWGVFTPMRQFVVVTWVVLLITLIIAYFYLNDLSVIDPDDLDSDEVPPNTEDDDEVSNSNVPGDALPASAVPAKPMIKMHTLRRWFPNQKMLHSEDDSAERSPLPQSRLNVESATTRPPNYIVYPTTHSSNNLSNIRNFFSQVMSILRLRNTWIVLVFGFLTMTVGMNWSASEIILPAFLERRFGEAIPIYTIQSINLIMCVMFPSILASLTADREVFQIIMPGLWLMASSPIFVAITPNVMGACLWQVFMTFGEVLWSPRQDAWTADLAPTGKEGLFFAVSRARALLG